MGRTRARGAAAVALVGVSTLLLAGCSLFGDDAPLPAPTGHAAPSASATPGPVGGSGDTAQPVAAPQAVPAGTVVAETDAVSKTGDTSIHVRVVANDHGTFDAQLSDYRTTQPQPMSVQFRRTAQYGDGGDTEAVATTQWDADAQPPATVSLSDGGPYPDWLHTVVLVPQSDGDDSARPWVYKVLAIGKLSWSIPNPDPDLHVTLGAARPGAYGYAFDAADETLRGTTGTPVSYKVNEGDDQSTIAKRFGITVDQLRWLNPTMQTRGNNWVLAGSWINLDPASR
ncbi:LysM peptidoglycan-binding domain-containing protein [Curtobacterium sp. 179-B 9B NHS]|uniref:LysM peptidoglycan-binding domain-containing protein n=1 Tax=Curtobacterium sp. 179-B 9B NHS TaxID=3374293 RepID=UPI003879763D